MRTIDKPLPSELIQIIESIRSSDAYSNARWIALLDRLYERGYEDGQLVAADSQKSGDSNVDTVRTLLLERSRVGQSKYHTTTDRTDLSDADWIQHAIEEGLDLVIYLERMRKNLERRMRRNR